jgi:hypothetical protein
MDEVEIVKRLAAFVGMAVAVTSLGASRALAATTTIVSLPISTVLTGNDVDLNSIFRSITIATTTSNYGGLTIVDSTTGNTVKKVDVSFLGGVSHGPILVRLEPFRPGPGSSNPIPEARTLLLYPLGLLAVGWAVLRRNRKLAPSHSA